MTSKEKIQQLEDRGDLDPTCKMCTKIFYPYYKNEWSDVRACKSTPFAPHHKASKYCLSGKNNHCTCDTCF